MLKDKPMHFVHAGLTVVFTVVSGLNCCGICYLKN